MDLRETSKAIFRGDHSSVEDFTVAALDLLHEFKSIADELGCDCDQYSMLFKIREMQRELDRQRKAIATLKRGGAVLPPEVTRSNPAWGS